jgi:hypothetical protein
MIEVISRGFNQNVIAFSAHGKVTHEDYRLVLIPAVDEKIKAHGKARLFYHLGSDVTGCEVEAVWDDVCTGLQNFTAFEKIAVVTNIRWLRFAVKAFGIFKPSPVKTFPNGNIIEATSWINA